MQVLKAIAMTSVAALALTLGPGVAPAAADVSRFVDNLNDAPRRIDVEWVRVNNGNRIEVTTSVANLRPHRISGLTVYFDTRRRDRGPEYFIAGGLVQGTDWQAARIENWRLGNGHLLIRCDSDLRLHYRSNRATFSIARNCFHDPRQIRVSVKGQTTTRRDWAPKRHRFYDWVRN